MSKSIGLSASVIGLMLSFSSAFAGSATWLANPGNGDWNTPANWTQGGPPNTAADTATFDFSTVGSLWVSGSADIGSIVFNAGAGISYTISVSTLEIFGSGITNNSGVTQNFIPGPYREVLFANSASAGFNTTFSMGGDFGEGSTTYFFGSSTAGHAALTAYGSNRSGGSGGGVSFHGNSSAGNATITVTASPCGPCYPGYLLFTDNTTAGNATLIVNDDIDGDPGVIAFQQVSTGGTARVKIFGNGLLDISSHDLDLPGLTIGSLEGDGIVSLGTFTLTVGSNNLNTNFSGLLRNGHGIPGGTAIGSLTKIGPGTVTLSGSNTYTGPTTINGGTLKVNGSITSAVAVNNGGALAGSGTTRNVTVNSGGIVVPGGSQILHINGNYTQNAGSILKIEVGGADPNASSRLDITGNATVGGTLEVRFVNGLLPISGQVIKVLDVDGALTGTFAQIIFPDLRAGFQFQSEFVNGTYQITALNDGVPATGFLNISTRMRVGTGDNALIGGFIVTGNAPKKVILRAIGPSLAPLAGRLADPTLELRDSAGGLIFSNDNWMDSPQVQEIIDSTIPPNDENEAAIVATLTPGGYTAIMRGVNDTTGIGVVEVYDLTPNVSASLANISSRGLVETGNNVMIGGFIAGNQATPVIARAIGPSLTQFGIANALADPTLELHDSNGAMIAFNNDWRDNAEAAIAATGIPPADNKESAILATLAPGNYTAIVRGLNDTVGVGLVEVYHLQ